MTKSATKTYNRKRPAHSDGAHTKAKRFFKQKGRKSARKFGKNNLYKMLSE